METQKIIAGIVAGGTLVMGGVDASVLNETAIQRVEAVAHERVEAKQIGNVVDTTFPWKGENGLKVKYDMGEPTAAEMLKDKRDKEVVTDLVDFGDGGFKVDILLNKKPDTNVFCYTIEGAENYDFFYQTPLTQQEIDEGSEQPDNIIGSYAVYHKTLRGHVVGKTNYETGKVMHIPRPQVWEVNDKENTTIWADLSYNEGQLCVTVDNNYLQKAKYPVRVDPTFGYTSIGGSTYNNNTDILIVSTLNSSVVGNQSVVDVNFYGCGVGTSNANTWQGGIYDTSSNLLSPQSSTQTITSRCGFGGEGWKTVTYSGPSLSTASYWPGVFFDFNSGGIQMQIYRDSGSSGDSKVQSSGITFPTWPNPATFTNSSYKYSIYATYTAGGGGGGGETKQDSDFWFE